MMCVGHTSAQKCDRRSTFLKRFETPKVSLTTSKLDQSAACTGLAIMATAWLDSTCREQVDRTKAAADASSWKKEKRA